MACNSQGFWTPWWWLRLSGRNMLEWLNNNKLIKPKLICAFCWFVLFFNLNTCTIFKKTTIHWRTIVVYQYSVKHNTILTVCDHKGYYMLWELNFTYITTTDYQEKCVEVKCVLNIKQYLWCVFYMQRGARGGVVVKVLCYKPTGRGFDSRWCHWNFSGT